MAFTLIKNLSQSHASILKRAREDIKLLLSAPSPPEAQILKRKELILRIVNANNLDPSKFPELAQDKPAPKKPLVRKKDASIAARVRELKDATSINGVAPLRRALSTADLAAIELYQHGDYHRLNSSLRAGGKIDKILKKRAVALDKAIEARTLKDPTTLWRGVSATQAELDALTVGATQKWKAYTSTSFKRRVALDFTDVGDKTILYKMKVPSGTPLAYMREFDGFIHDEALLGRNHKITVTSKPKLIHQEGIDEVWEVEITVEPKAAPKPKVKPKPKPAPRPKVSKAQLPAFTGTANEQFFDALIRHQIGLMRLSGSIKKDVNALLNASEKDMAARIHTMLKGRTGLNTPADVRRMQKLVAVLKSTRLKSWTGVTKLWLQEMNDLAQLEPTFVDMALKTSVPVVLETTLPSNEFLRSIVRAKPFEGKTMRQWARNIQAADLRRIEDQIKIGMVQGESSATIARRVVGSARLNGTNGVTEITRRQAAAISRTAVNAIANQAKRAYYEANSDVFEKEQYVATLDGRTTLICQGLDGTIHPIGKGPIPPVHFMCRSLRVAVIGKDLIGNRPMVRGTEKQMLREFSKDRKLTGIVGRADLPRGTKGAFDTFSRKRMRELTGTTPAKVTYQQFLGRQTVGFQDDVLGVTRGKLFRKGGLTLDKFTDRTGGELTLAQLKDLHGAAFAKAGL